jgi:hypothetical protein
VVRKGKDGRIKLTATGVAFKPIAQGLLDARDEAIAALVAIERGEIRALKSSSCMTHAQSCSEFVGLRRVFSESRRRFEISRTLCSARAHEIALTAHRMITRTKIA